MEHINAKQIEFDGFKDNDERFLPIIESILFVSGEPVKLKEIASIIECSPQNTKSILENIQNYYENDKKRGIKLIEINGEYQLVSKPENSQYVQRLLKTNMRISLSQASLETLAIIAYKQPITRIDIDSIRGVKSGSAIITLIEKKLIKESGRLDVPGRPILYSTTDEFLKKFGFEDIKKLKSLDDFVKKEENEN